MPTYYEESGRLDAAIPLAGEESRKERESLAAYLTGGLLIAQAVGSLIGGVLSDFVLRRTGSLRLARNGVALFSLGGSVALYLAAYPIANVYVSTAVFGLGVLVFTFSSPCAYALDHRHGREGSGHRLQPDEHGGQRGGCGSSSPSCRPCSRGVGRLGRGGSLLVFVGMHLVAAACWVWLDPNAKLSPGNQALMRALPRRFRRGPTCRVDPSFARSKSILRAPDS